MLIGIDGNEANTTDRVGSGQYGYELLRAIYALNLQHSFEIFLKNPPVFDMPKEKENWRYLVFGPKRFWTQVALPLQIAFKKNKPDVFFSPSHYAPRFSSIPQVITIFDLSFLYFEEYFRKKDLTQLKRWTKYSVFKSQAVITISENSKKDVVKEYKIDSKKVFVTYPGYDKLKFKPKVGNEVSRVKEKYQIPGDYIIFIGTLQPRKNLDRLIEAFARLKRKHQNLNLVVVGKKGWLFASIFAKVSQLGLEKEIIFTDFAPTEDLPALLSGARLYALPSLYEGFGIPVVEAMACGVPVAVSQVSSLPEVVGRAGLLFDPLDIGDIEAKCEKILSDEKLARDLSKKGLERANMFDWTKTAKDTMKILKSVPK